MSSSSGSLVATVKLKAEENVCVTTILFWSLKKILIYFNDLSLLFQVFMLNGTSENPSCGSQFKTR
jgi:hypothetical protein